MPERQTAADDTAPSAGGTSILFLVLRRMRVPLITIILVYAVSIFGMTQIPGIDAEGRPTPPMSVFHALYFISYTATTIGFGEIPSAFSDAQRMWVIVAIHLTVIGWTYAVLTLLSLFQDASFQRALASIRFERRVRRTGEPFFLILGCGDTGQRLIRILDWINLRFVVVEQDAARIDALELEDFRSDAPVICADARSPQVLIDAGLGHRHCVAVLALTDDDRANVAIAAAARLLAPRLPVLARAHTPATAENLRSFGVEHVIEPFSTFADHLALAMRAPGCYRLHRWLTAPPDTELDVEHEPPRGLWVVCGYGRFGRRIAQTLVGQQVELRIIDTVEQDGVQVVLGIGTEREVLELAGIAQATGIVAGTDDDIANIAILAMARQLNPGLFTVARQNESVNQVLFERIQAHLVMRPSALIAAEALARLTTPLLDRFIEAMHRQTDAWADEVILRLTERTGTRAPKLWSIALDATDAPAISEAVSNVGTPMTIGDLLRDPTARDEPLPARALMLVRADTQVLIPDERMRLMPQDRLLFAGRGEARRALELSQHNFNLVEYLRTGRDLPGGWVWRKFSRR
jgi:Trk K+ transport system NAD-binding subunit